MNNWDLGQKGEELVLKKYLEEGYQLVSKNFQYYSQGVRGRLGEIDLVLKKDNFLILVEVKSRSNNSFGDPVEQITQKKLRHLYKAYQFFLAKNPSYRECFCRFDVGSVLNDKIEIIENAYSFDGLF